MDEKKVDEAVSNYRPRGFAAMTPEQRREIGARGGKRAHELGKAYRFTSETASAAGKIPHELGTAHQWTPEEASEAGRKGGMSKRVRAERDGSEP